MISSFCTMVHWGSFKGLNKIHFLFIKKHFWFVKKVCFHIYIGKMKNLRTNTVYVFILSFLESIFQDVFRSNVALWNSVLRTPFLPVTRVRCAFLVIQSSFTRTLFSHVSCVLCSLLASLSCVLRTLVHFYI